ncbi:MAG: hypothetical protein AB1467_05425 [Candidatus Diapherotrites archaeon]
MEIKLIKKSEGITRTINKNYGVTNFLTKELSKNLSVALSNAVKHCEKTKNTRSDRAYYILKGKLTVRKGNKKFMAKKGELIFIPKNTEYTFEGTFKAILINSPAFRPQDEKTKYP